MIRRLASILIAIGMLFVFTHFVLSDSLDTLISPHPQSQGYSPFGFKISKDGQYGFLSFDLSEIVFKIRLSDLSVVAETDLSAYFPIEAESIALDATDKKLFVYTPSWHKLLVLDTETMSLIHTIDDYTNYGMSQSQDGVHLITWGGGPVVQIINTNNYEITQETYDNLFIQFIQEEKDDPSKWFMVAQAQPGGQGPVTAGVYDPVAKLWVDSVTFLLPADGASPFDFSVLPNGKKAYIAYFGGWYPDFHAYGWLVAVNLETKQTTTVPVDGGAMCLAVNPAGTRLFVGTGWPLPNTNNLLSVDTASDNIIGSIPIGQNPYGWPYTQMNDLEIDPVHPNILYATNADGNSLVKVNIESLTLVSAHVFNKETYRPRIFVQRPVGNIGNVLIHNSSVSFELNRDTAEIQKLDVFPAIRQDAYMYDIGVLDSGNLLIAQGEYFLEVDPQNMHLIAKHLLPASTPSVWAFVMSNDKTKIYAVSYTPEGEPHIFLAINTTSFQVERQLNLSGGDFGLRPFELPDSSKLYVLGGEQNGPVVVHVINTSDHTIQNSILYDQPDHQGISITYNNPYAFDPASGTLFLGATQVVLAIDTRTDTITQVINLADVEAAIGLQPSTFTYINAVGLVYNPHENYLYIAHLDRSFISIYDLTRKQFLSKVIPLKGYFPNFLFSDNSYEKIYSINGRSDSISVIDVSIKKVVKVIDLHDYLHQVYLPSIVK